MKKLKCARIFVLLLAFCLLAEGGYAARYAQDNRMLFSATAEAYESILGQIRMFNIAQSAARRVWEGLEIEGRSVPTDQQISIEKLLKGCTDPAGNLVALMKMYPDAAKAERAALERARDAMRAAGDPESTAQADHDLFVCFRNAMDAWIGQAEVAGEHLELLDEVVMSFNAARRQLALRARDYDRQLQKAIDLYDLLPYQTKIPKPALYQDIAQRLKAEE